MTREGNLVLETELKNLKSVERPNIIQAISEAREHGDLSENAEYHSAREKHSFIEGRIKEIEAIISLAEVIDPTSWTGALKFGATVTLVDEDTDEEKTWQIVGEHEANIEAGLLNMKSPIARALIGKDEGDSVEVKTPGGEKAYEILKIEYKWAPLLINGAGFGTKALFGKFIIKPLIRFFQCADYFPLEDVRK